MIPADVKANKKKKKEKIVRLKVQKYNVKSYLPMYFSFDFGWYSIQFDIVH